MPPKRGTGSRGHPTMKDGIGAAKAREPDDAKVQCWEHEDKLMEQVILVGLPGDCQKSLDLVRHGREFERTRSPGDRVGECEATWRRNFNVWCIRTRRLCWTSAGVELKHSARLRLHPERFAEVEEEIFNSAYEKGLKDLAKATAPKRKRAYPSFAQLLTICQLTTRADQDARRENEYKAFWQLLIMTGARPANLMIAPFKIDSECVRVQWRRRKGGRTQIRNYTPYKYVWSAPPDDSTMKTLRQIARSWEKLLPKEPYMKDKKWVFPSPWFFSEAAGDRVASYVNRWVQKLPIDTKTQGVQWTSTTPRNVLSSHLLALVQSDQLSARDFVWLMDHTVETALGHYASDEILCPVNEEPAPARKRDRDE